MKKTLFLALALCCTLPVMADAGHTLSGEGIANNCTWNLYATFDSLAYTDTFTTLATVNLNNNAWPAIYAVGYTYSSVDNTLTLGMASYADPSWKTLSLGSVTLGADMPLSFALSHNGSNEGGNDTVALRGATGNTTTNFTLSAPKNSTATDKYTNQHISSVSLGTEATSTRIFNRDLVLTPATGTNVNLVGARLEHEAYSDAAFEEFVLEEQPFAADEVVRYTTVESGNQKNVYSYGTANGEVTFNPDKFDESGKLVLDKTINLTAHTTFIVEDGKTVEISGADHFTGADGKTHEKGSAFGSGELVKSGGGTLAIRLNDTNRNIATSENNDFDGSITVEEGTLYIFHDDENPSAFKARPGGGDNTVITVKEGAVLEMGDQTQISIPLGAHASTEENAHNTVIDGGPVQVKANAAYGIPEIQTETSTIKDVVINREGLDQVDREVRAELIVSGITVSDMRDDEGGVAFKHADIIANDFHYQAHTVIRNTNMYVDHQLVATTVNDKDGNVLQRFTLEVTDNSYVVYGAAVEGWSWGHVDNLYVDKTSRFQTSANDLEHDWGGAMQIQGLCTLDIEDIMLNRGGLAEREIGTVQGVLDGKVLTLTDIQYRTDQLSGDMLVKYDEDIHGTLDLRLKDTVGHLPEGTTIKNTVFTLTLTNFDSSLLVVDEFGNLDPTAAKLTVDAFEGSQWHLVYGRYDAETNNSIFTFSTMEHLIIPEPATATLSLLALAGLAARRRRR